MCSAENATAKNVKTHFRHACFLVRALKSQAKYEL